LSYGMTTLSGKHQGTLESLLSRLETVTSRLENIKVLVQLKPQYCRGVAVSRLVLSKQC